MEIENKLKRLVARLPEKQKKLDFSCENRWQELSRIQPDGRTLKVDQAKRFKELTQENARLKKLLAEAELDKAILREAANPNF